jgi:two-component system, LytTR family, response regulator
MKVLKAIIVEDEEVEQIVLTELLKVAAPNVEIVGIASNYLEAIALMRDAEYDLAFLDIQLKNYNIFDVLAQVENKGARYIFVTAYDQYALPAIKARCIDYLLKPININELKAAVKLCISDEDILDVSVDRKTGIFSTERLVVSTHSGIHLFKYEEILYLSSERNYTYIYSEKEPQLLASKSLISFEEQLPNPPFFRIHHTFLVNLDKIRKIGKGKDPYVVLTDGTLLEISRSKKAQLFSLFL